MGKPKNKIPKPPVLVGGVIPKPSLPAPCLSFSFRYMDLRADKFHWSLSEDGYWETFFDRLKAVSAMTRKYLMTDMGIKHSLHSHAIDFASTSEPNGFDSVKQELWQNNTWQFALTVNKHGRLHGFWDGDVFYVVWFDPMHNLYPGRT